MESAKKFTVAVAGALLLVSCRFETICVAAESIDVSNITCYGNETVCADRADACVWSWGRCAHRCDLHNGNTTRCMRASGCVSLTNGTCVQDCFRFSPADSLGCTGANLSHCMSPVGFVATKLYPKETCLPRCGDIQNDEEDVCEALGCNYLSRGPSEGSCALDCGLYGTDTAGCEASGASSGLQCMMQLLTSGSSVCLPNCSAAGLDGACYESVGRRVIQLCTNRLVGGVTTCELDCQVTNILAGIDMCPSSSCAVFDGPTNSAKRASRSCVMDCSRITDDELCTDYSCDCEWTGSQCVTACSLLTDCDVSPAVRARCANLTGECRTRCEVLDQRSCLLNPRCMRLNSSACGYKCDVLNATTDCLTGGRESYCISPQGSNRCWANCSALTEVDCDLDNRYCRRPSELSQNRCRLSCLGSNSVDRDLCDSSTCSRVAVSSPSTMPQSHMCIPKCDAYLDSEACNAARDLSCVWTEDLALCAVPCLMYRYGADCPAQHCSTNPVTRLCEPSCTNRSTRGCASGLGCVWAGDQCTRRCSALSPAIDDQYDPDLSGRTLDDMKAVAASLCSGSCFLHSNGTRCSLNCSVFDNANCVDNAPNGCDWVGSRCVANCDQQEAPYCHSGCYLFPKNQFGTAHCAVDCSLVSDEVWCHNTDTCEWVGDQCRESCRKNMNVTQCPDHCHKDATALIQCSPGGCFDRSEDECNGGNGRVDPCIWEPQLPLCVPTLCSQRNESSCVGRCLYLSDVARCVDNCTLNPTGDLCAMARGQVACHRLAPDSCSADAGCMLMSHESLPDYCSYNCTRLSGPDACAVREGSQLSRCVYVFNSTCTQPCSTLSTGQECSERRDCFNERICRANCSALSGNVFFCERELGCEVADATGSCGVICSSFVTIADCNAIGAPRCKWTAGSCVVDCQRITDEAECNTVSCRFLGGGIGCIPRCQVGDQCPPGSLDYCEEDRGPRSSVSACTEKCSAFTPGNDCGGPEVFRCQIDPLSPSQCSPQCESYGQTECPADRCGFKVKLYDIIDEQTTIVDQHCMLKCSASTSKTSCGEPCRWIGGTCVESCNAQNCTLLPYCAVGAHIARPGMRYPGCRVRCSYLTSQVNCGDHLDQCIFHDGLCIDRCSAAFFMDSGMCPMSTCTSIRQALTDMPSSYACHRNCSRFGDVSSCTTGPEVLSGECVWLPGRGVCVMNCTVFTNAEVCPDTHCRRDETGTNECVNIGEVQPTSEPVSSVSPVATTNAPTAMSTSTASGITTPATNPTTLAPDPTQGANPSPPVMTSTVEASIVLAGTHWADVIGSPNASLLEDDLRQDLAVYTSVNLTQVVISETGVRGGLAVNFTIANVTNVSTVVAFLEAIGAASPQSAFPATLSRYEASSAGAAAEVRVLSSTAEAVTIAPAPMTEVPPMNPGGEETLLEGSALSAGAVLLIVLAVIVVGVVGVVVVFAVKGGHVVRSGGRWQYNSVGSGGNDVDDSDDFYGDTELEARDSSGPNGYTPVLVTAGSVATLKQNPEDDDVLIDVEDPHMATTNNVPEDDNILGDGSVAGSPTQEDDNDPNASPDADGEDIL